MEEKPKNNTFTKIREWIKNHIAITAIIAGVFVIALATVIIIAGMNGKSNKNAGIAANATTGSRLSSNDDSTTEYNETDPGTDPELPTDPVIDKIELESYTVVNDGKVELVKTYITEDGSEETEIEPLTEANGDAVTVAPETTEAATATDAEQTTSAPARPSATQPATEPATAAPTKPSATEPATKPAPATPAVEIKNGTVVKINGVNGVAVIPSTYDGKAVTTIPASVVVADSVKEITIPSSITKWEEYAFEDNCNLTKVTVDSNAMPDRAFAGCKSLTTVELGSNCKKISLAAFELCSSLTTVKIGRGVNYIGDGAFSRCNSLRELYIPKNVTTLASFLVFDDAWYSYWASTGETVTSNEQIKGRIPNIKIYFEGSSINITEGYWASTLPPYKEGTTNTVNASNLGKCLWGIDSEQRERFTVKFGVAYPY